MRRQPPPITDEALRADCRRRGVDRLDVVVRFRRAGIDVAEVLEPRRAGVPVGDAVGRRMGDVEVACRRRGAIEKVHHRRLAAMGRQRCFVDRVEEFEQLGVAGHRPRKPPHPGGEAGIALLGVDAAEGAAHHVEDRFVSGAAALVPDVAALVPEQAVRRRRPCMHDEPADERDDGIAFALHHVAELVSQRQHAQRPHGVDEQRMRPVE